MEIKTHVLTSPQLGLRADTQEAAQRREDARKNIGAVGKIKVSPNDSLLPTTGTDEVDLSGYVVPSPDSFGKYLKSIGAGAYEWSYPSGIEQQQVDWAQTDTQSVDYIKNKPGTFGPASAQQAGTDGFVPAPQSGDQDKYLKGDGTWATINIPEVADMVGATAQADGTHGLVPAPETTDKDKFLKGDGTWANVDNTRACTAEDIDQWINDVDSEETNNG